MISIVIRRSGTVIHESRHRTSDPNTAIDRAVTRRWGRSAYFSCSGVIGSRRYGQIVNGTSGSCLTDLISIEAVI